jgi:hypothetical protein
MPAVRNANAEHLQNHFGHLTLLTGGAWPNCTIALLLISLKTRGAVGISRSSLSVFAIVTFGD